ncbi:antitoxin [Amycolatopsis sp. A1MSW2902]|uniref:type II toxin-antitoxin system TacA family antitoxin n=1 Tax=Amycolatopsis sp. A1MSW2902 TaxID=687413 RepID=UPI00307D0E1B
MTQRPAAERPTRDERINLRATTRQEQLLRSAAAATDRTMTEFILDSAVTQAERVMSDRRWFVLDEASWQRFEELLDMPVRDLPRLRKLFAEPSPFADEDE